MNLDLLDIAPVFSDVNKCKEYLCGRNLLLNDLWCCRVQCSKVTDISLSDKEILV